MCSLKGGLRVFGHVRPRLPAEEGELECLRVAGKQDLQVLVDLDSCCQPLDQPLQQSQGRGAFEEAPCTFRFDQLFGLGTGVEELHAALQQDFASAVEGEAVCVIAYGPPSSGKTYTVSSLFDKVAQELQRQVSMFKHDTPKVDVVAQAIEVQNDQLVDLLSCEGPMESSRRKLYFSGREPAVTGATLLTLDKETPGGVEEGLRQAMRFAQAQRSTCAEALQGGRSRSSCSHLVMTLFLRSHDSSTGAIERVGRLTFVDLAGCERPSLTGATGATQRRESLHLQRSLGTLADVLALAFARERRSSGNSGGNSGSSGTSGNNSVPSSSPLPVPYRNSKLTQLLQDVLGGQERCRAVVIMTMAPTYSTLGSTLHALQFGARLTGLGLGLGPSPCSSRPSFRSQRPSLSLSSGHLRHELSMWRSEYEKVQALLAECQGALDAKDRELHAVRRRNAQLVQTARSRERSHAELLQGFASFNRRLQDLEASTSSQAQAQAQAQDDVDSSVSSAPCTPLASGSLGAQAALLRPSHSAGSPIRTQAGSGHGRKTWERTPVPGDAKALPFCKQGTGAPSSCGSSPSRRSRPNSADGGAGVSRPATGRVVPRAAQQKTASSSSSSSIDSGSLRKAAGAKVGAAVAVAVSCDLASALSPCAELEQGDSEDVDTAAELSSPNSSGRLSSWHSSPCPDSTPGEHSASGAMPFQTDCLRQWLHTRGLSAGPGHSPSPGRSPGRVASHSHSPVRVPSASHSPVRVPSASQSHSHSHSHSHSPSPAHNRSHSPPNPHTPDAARACADELLSAKARDADIDIDTQQADAGLRVCQCQGGASSQVSISVSVSSDEAAMQTRWRRSLLQRSCGRQAQSARGGARPSATAARSPCGTRPHRRSSCSGSVSGSGSGTGSGCGSHAHTHAHTHTHASARPLTSPPPPAASALPPATVLRTRTAPVVRAQLPWWLLQQNPNPHARAPCQWTSGEAAATSRPSSARRRSQLHRSLAARSPESQ